MSAEKIDEQISRNYTEWLRAQGFEERSGQLEMIKFIANALQDRKSRKVIVQAGTGTGKTAAYVLGAVPVAKADEKTLIVVTATVALQEQVVEKDLPALSKWSLEEFDFVVAKGRRRYVCPRRLDTAVNETNQKRLFDEIDKASQYADTYRRMWSAFTAKQWLGDRDSWDGEITSFMWSPISTDHRGCTNRECDYYHECPYFKARSSFQSSTVVVTNYDLLLTALSTGSEVLPPPEDSIYILDEAHHLVDKTMSAFRSSIGLNHSEKEVSDCQDFLSELMQKSRRDPTIQDHYRRFGEQSTRFLELNRSLVDLLQRLSYTDEQSGTGVHRFAKGEVPNNIRAVSALLATAQDSMASCLDVFKDEMQLVINGQSDWIHSGVDENQMNQLLDYLAFFEDTVGLLRAYGSVDAGEKYSAKWAQHDVGSGPEDWTLKLVPVEVDSILKEILWERCHGAVFTSATLGAGDEFSYFKNSVGVPQATRHTEIASPFDYQSAVTLTVPKMRYSPRYREQRDYLKELVASLPARLELEKSALVLFTSRATMNQVLERMPTRVRRRVLLQDSMGKQALLEKHKNLVDQGKPSYIFGLESYREGIDLPGDYCKHVIVTKLPFAVPTDPVEKTREELCAARGSDYFFDVSVPETTLRLIQGFGRLIRSESDRGRITLYDNRFVKSGYGQHMQSSIPPYKIIIEE